MKPGTLTAAVLILALLPGCRTWTSREERAAVAFNRGNASRDAGDPDAAIEAYRDAIEEDPEFYRAYYNLALVESDRGNREEAEDLLRFLMTIDSRNLAVHRALAWVAWQDGDVEAALDWYRRALALFEGDVASLSGAAEVLESLDRWEEAISYRQRQYDIDDSDASLVALAEAYAGAGRDTRAIESYESLLAGNPADEEGREALASLYEKVGDPASAVQHWKILVEGGGEGSTKAEWRLGHIYLVDLGEYAAGLNSIDRALEKGFDDQESMDLLMSEIPTELVDSVEKTLAKPREQIEETISE